MKKVAMNVTPVASESALFERKKEKIRRRNDKVLSASKKRFLLNAKVVK